MTEESKVFPSQCKESHKPYLLPLNDEIKLIDFGGATFANEHKTKIINTRQYRAPEVLTRNNKEIHIESVEWDEKSDIWSVACILVELYSGEPLFNARNDEEHKEMIEKVVGEFPRWMHKRSHKKPHKRVRRMKTLSVSN